MKKQLIALATLAALGTSAQAQEIYLGVSGLAGPLTVGYAHSMGSSWGLRGEYAGGLNLSKDGVQEGVNVTGSLKANHTGLFADWFPFGGGFRLTGGVTMNDMKAEMNALGSGTATIGNVPNVDMTGETFNVSIKYPTSTPYIGIGYGHQASAVKGLGFYADLGVTMGSFDVSVATSLVTNNKVAQADVDAQTKKMRDAVSSLSVLPRASIGLVYRF